MTIKLELKAGERLDDLCYHGRRIIQREDEFCFSLDAVLLARFASYKKHATLLDLGTGTGVLPLLAIDNVRRAIALELNPIMADIARRNVALNELGTKIEVLEGDYREIKTLLPAESVDHVLANPPYRALNSGERDAVENIARARHELTATLDDVLSAASYALKFRGYLSLVHIPERLGDIFCALERHHLAPKRLRLVAPKRGKRPNLLLLEAIKGGAAGGLIIEPELVVHEADGSYTREVAIIYGLEDAL